MTWTFRANRPNSLGPISLEIRDPDLNDRDRRVRRQARGETEAGSFFVQDLDRTDEFIEVAYESLSRCEKSDVLAFFEGIRYQCKPFEIEVESLAFALEIGTEQGWSTGDGLTTGEIKSVSEPVQLGLYRLDQPFLEFRSLNDFRYNLSLRFRRVKGSLQNLL